MLTMPSSPLPTWNRFQRPHLGCGPRRNSGALQARWCEERAARETLCQTIPGDVEWALHHRDMDSLHAEVCSVGPQEDRSCHPLEAPNAPTLSPEGWSVVARQASVAYRGVVCAEVLAHRERNPECSWLREGQLPPRGAIFGWRPWWHHSGVTVLVLGGRLIGLQTEPIDYFLLEVIGCFLFFFYYNMLIIVYITIKHISKIFKRAINHFFIIFS